MLRAYPVKSAGAPHTPELEIQLAFDVGREEAPPECYYVLCCKLFLLHCFLLQNVVIRCLRQCRTL